jgi:polyhydroxyalkanoate synthesis regulator phasin
MDYTFIEFLVGIVAIVGFMYKFEKDTRSEVKAELRTNIDSLRRDVEELRSEMRSGFSRLANAIDSVGEAIIDYLGVRGVLDPNEARFLRAVIKNLASTITTTNPLTEEERKRLLELVDKDDLTIEEAEELYRLARKLYREYIDKTPDAFAALLYAAYKRKEAYMKHWQTTQPTNTQS